MTNHSIHPIDRRDQITEKVVGDHRADDPNTPSDQGNNTMKPVYQTEATKKMIDELFDAFRPFITAAYEDTDHYEEERIAIATCNRYGWNPLEDEEFAGWAISATGPEIAVGQLQHALKKCDADNVRFLIRRQLTDLAQRIDPNGTHSDVDAVACDFHSYESILDLFVRWYRQDGFGETPKVWISNLPTDGVVVDTISALHKALYQSIRDDG